MKKYLCLLLVSLCFVSCQTNESIPSFTPKERALMLINDGGSYPEIRDDYPVLDTLLEMYFTQASDDSTIRAELLKAIELQSTIHENLSNLNEIYVGFKTEQYKQEKILTVKRNTFKYKTVIDSVVPKIKNYHPQFIGWRLTLNIGYVSQLVDKGTLYWDHAEYYYFNPLITRMEAIDYHFDGNNDNDKNELIKSYCKNSNLLYERLFFYQRNLSYKVQRANAY